MSDRDLKTEAFGTGPGATGTAVDAVNAAIAGDAGSFVPSPGQTIGERNAFIKSAVDLILASNRTDAEKTQLIADIATANNVSIEDFSAISGISASVIRQAAATHNVTFPPEDYTFPPGHDPVISTGPITPSQYPATFQNQKISKMSNDALLAAYGAALEELNGVRSTRNMARAGYEGMDTYFDAVADAEATWEAIKAAISAKGLEIPTGTFTQNVTAAGRTVGGWMDKIFDYFGIARPDYAVAQVGPGGTLIWGTPQGSVFARIGTTPGGTKIGRAHV